MVSIVNEVIPSVLLKPPETYIFLCCTLWVINHQNLLLREFHGKSRCFS